ncbi:MAG: GTP 3',8-cyclase MoaA, partial [Planctomycetota bacterium]
MTPQDLLKRPLRNLRLSVTDRCNLRCGYCMPEENYAWLPHQDILSFEEMGRLVEIFSRLGVDKVRLTGGEPLLRRDLPVLIDIVANIPAIRDIALTTNGVLLVDQAQALRDAGLRRLTVSLDTLRRERFQQMTRRDDLPRVLAGIEAGRNANFDALKLDTVAVKGQNDDEIVDMVAFAREIGAEVRFIEYMDVGGATQWSPAKVISRDEILALIGAAYGKPEPLPKTDWAPANRYRLPDGSVFGVIASTTAPFCQ